MKEEIRKRNAYSREFSSTSTHVQTDAEPIRECVWVTDLPPQQIIPTIIRSDIPERMWKNYITPLKNQSKLKEI